MGSEMCIRDRPLTCLSCLNGWFFWRGYWGFFWSRLRCWRRCWFRTWGWWRCRRLRWTGRREVCHLLWWRRWLLYLRQLRRRSHDAIITSWLRFGLWLWFRFRAGIRFWLKLRLRNRVRFRFLHWAIRLGHDLQALRGAFHNESHAY